MDLKRTKAGIEWGTAALVLGLLGFLVMSLDFVAHAAALGWQGLTRDLSGESRLYWPEQPIATSAIFLHMISGAVATVLAPLQVIGALRMRWPSLHRWGGRVLVGAALLTGVAGLVYILARGTIGGWDMSLSFGIYGALMILCATQSYRFARLRVFSRHRRWALRLFVLAIGSWLYRLHYGLWFMATGGAHVLDDFSGGFDLANIWAFYVPYLLLLELLFAFEARGKRPSPA